ncbi:hypothetical protein A2U01_0021737, partial [Trifolium medium]|nr:hypothetical protein [Trifolium medium]
MVDCGGGREVANE